MTPGPGSKNETIKSNFTLRTCTCSKLGGLFVQFDGEPEKGGLTRRNCITASDTHNKRENCWVLQVNTLCCRSFRHWRGYYLCLLGDFCFLLTPPALLRGPCVQTKWLFHSENCSAAAVFRQKVAARLSSSINIFGYW